MMKAILRFLASPAGRVARIVAGVALIVIGLVLVGGFWTWLLVVVGAAMLLAGVFDFCIFAPLFRLPFMGPGLREKL
jgi:uncharacterized membrane protein YphA (DoxX/SURF4 family)